MCKCVYVCVRMRVLDQNMLVNTTTYQTDLHSDTQNTYTLTHTGVILRAQIHGTGWIIVFYVRVVVVSLSSVFRSARDDHATA